MRLVESYLANQVVKLYTYIHTPTHLHRIQSRSGIAKAE